MEGILMRSRTAFIAGGSLNACGGWRRVVAHATRATTSSSLSMAPSVLAQILVDCQTVMSDGFSSPLVSWEGMDTDDSGPRSGRLAPTWLSRVNKTLRAPLCCARGRFQTAESDYEVLIRDGANLVGSNVMPLSDPRLKPRLPKLLIIFLVLLSLGGILCVFFLVPRGISLLEPNITVDTFVLDSTNQSFALVVGFELPFKNPNYVSVDVTGQVNMTYYHTLADSKDINITLPRLSSTQETVFLDSRRMNVKYITTVISHCFVFPHEDVFFINGEFKARYLLQTQHLSVDTYSFINCSITPTSPRDWLGIS